MSPDALVPFAAASLALVAVPGPAVALLVTRSAAEGPRAGLATMLGLEAGSLVHVLLAVTGLAAALASVPAALDVLRWGGLAYLVWLAIGAVRHRHAAAEPAGRAFRQAFLVEALNPKTALFFSAFLPQFVDPAHPAAPQLLVLGLLFVAVAAVGDCAYVLAGAYGRRALRRVRP